MFLNTCPSNAKLSCPCCSLAPVDSAVQQSSRSSSLSSSCPFVLFVRLPLFLPLPPSPLCLVTGRAAVRGINRWELDVLLWAPSHAFNTGSEPLVAAHRDCAGIHTHLRSVTRTALCPSDLSKPNKACAPVDDSCLATTFTAAVLCYAAHSPQCEETVWTLMSCQRNHTTPEQRARWWCLFCHLCNNEHCLFLHVE